MSQGSTARGRSLQFAIVYVREVARLPSRQACQVALCVEASIQHGRLMVASDQMLGKNVVVGMEGGVNFRDVGRTRPIIQTRRAGALAH